MIPAPALSPIDERGFAWARRFVGCDRCSQLCGALGELTGAGRRDVLSVPAVLAFAQAPELLALVAPHVDGLPQPVRALAFDKSTAVNWPVAWHQDLTIAVHARSDVAGFGPWSHKDGVPHVQPPLAVLERMLALRVHLDDAGEQNGALRVLPGTHRAGRLASAHIATLRDTVDENVCAAAAGDVLLMRPLLLHASHRATAPGHRRVLHIEYAGGPLPGGLRWRDHFGISR